MRTHGMAKRLQVILQDSEDREVQRAARSRHMSIAEWVRQSLEFARRRSGDIGNRLAAVRAAAQHNFPVRDIDGMLEEVEKGRA